jgi:hypothetical protein
MLVICAIDYLLNSYGPFVRRDVSAFLQQLRALSPVGLGDFSRSVPCRLNTELFIRSHSVARKQMVSVPRIGNNSKLANYSWESPKEHSICNPAGDLTINRISKAPSHPRRRLRRSQVQWRQPGTRRRRSWPPPRWRSSPSSPRRGTTMPARRRSRPSASACRTWSGRRPRRRPTAARASATSGTWAAAAWRRALCACVLSEVQAAGEMEPRRAAGLAAACKVPVGFVPTKPDFNCSA